MTKTKTTLTIELFDGFHDPFLTRQFVQSFEQVWEETIDAEMLQLRFIAHALNRSLARVVSLGTGNSAIHGSGNDVAARVMVGFSAGVINAAIATKILIAQRNPPLALIAVDGWGVPLVMPCPIYRISHDVFTHLSSEVLGGDGVFFADPPATHLQLWTNPEQTQGWFVSRVSSSAMEMNLADVWTQLIRDLGSQISASST